MPAVVALELLHGGDAFAVPCSGGFAGEVALLDEGGLDLGGALCVHALDVGGDDLVGGLGGSVADVGVGGGRCVADGRCCKTRDGC